MCVRQKQNVIGWSPLPLGPFNATKLVAALLSFDNRWANGFCHLTPVCLRTADHRHTEMLYRAQSGVGFWTLNK